MDRRIYHPWRHLDGLGLDVAYANLGDEAGCWDPDTSLIWIDKQLTQAQRRSTLAHELVHAENDHEPCCSPWHERKQERAVEQEAARRLIDLDDLMDALAWCTSLGEVAEELQVDRSILDARIDTLDAEDQAVIHLRFIDEWSIC
jgi:Zn-dependent peptidase ImmA (M78 family)